MPPISSASTEERTRVYDFTIYRDLVDFQDKMREAYGYIEGHVKYMHLCQQNKADKGGYDGRALPPGLAVKGKKQDQIIVIYEPWAEEMLIGWWQPDADKPDTIIDNHPAVLDHDMFAEGYAELKGYTLEGERVDNWGGITRIRKTREAPPDLLFHGRLAVVPPGPDRTAFISVDEHRSKWYYYGHSRQAEGMVTDKFLSIPGAPFDNIVIERLKALERADKQMQDKVRATLEQVYRQQSEDFVSIPRQIEGIQIQLVENA